MLHLTGCWWPSYHTFNKARYTCPFGVLCVEWLETVLALVFAVLCSARGILARILWDKVRTLKSWMDYPVWEEWASATAETELWCCPTMSRAAEEAQVRTPTFLSLCYEYEPTSHAGKIPGFWFEVTTPHLARLKLQVITWIPESPWSFVQSLQKDMCEWNMNSCSFKKKKSFFRCNSLLLMLMTVWGTNFLEM